MKILGPEMDPGFQLLLWPSPRIYTEVHQGTELGRIYWKTEYRQESANQQVA